MSKTQKLKIYFIITIRAQLERLAVIKVMGGMTGHGGRDRGRALHGARRGVLQKLFNLLCQDNHVTNQ